MVLAAQLNGLPPRVLPSIQAVEGGAPGVVHLNADGSEDLGVMQVNTRWLGPLARYTGQTPDYVRQRLLGADCYNVVAAGLIYRTYLVEARGDMMQAIGFYHSHTAPLGAHYREQVIASATRLFVAAPPATATRPVAARGRVERQG